MGSDADLDDACDALGRALERGACSPRNDDVAIAVIGRIEVYLQSSDTPRGDRPSKRLGEDSCRALGRLYRQLGSTSTDRHLLLRRLAEQDSPEALSVFVEAICSDPPLDAEHAALAMVPLFARERRHTASLFPRLLDALEHASIAPLILDLANFLVREGGQNEHPAAGRSAALATLLGEMTQRLEKLNESPETVGAAQRNKMVADAVALMISLCDALALIGDRSVVGKLFQALELSHRRIRTEAAAALARLGEDEGLKVLVEMAEQPLVRNRALAYLEELGETDRVDEEQRSPQARAESDLVCWLAEPAQFGTPPQSLELFDSARQYWPGFDEPVDCFLFRYAYVLAAGELSAIGMAGPLVHSFSTDLQDMPPADIYAAFAGWQAEHEEVYEVQIEKLGPSDTAQLQRVRGELQHQDFDDVEFVSVGHFFGQTMTVATATRAGQSGTVIYQTDRISWCPQGNPQSPVDASLAYNIHKGRILLRTFNPQ
ncbi:MAG: HEAT repeat domain-containing protein [Planctomycetes bacterium]|nr:HEAT repeat domain-containing protein [Planctomycetota bacterium]